MTGEVIEECKREDIVLATKGAHKFAGDKMKTDHSPAFLKQTEEDSLRRLHIDYISLHDIYCPDELRRRMKGKSAPSGFRISHSNS
nr:aldo/keto reductase [Bacillus xiapuensis]